MSGPIRYKPIPVKEILKKMKNISELMIDLSYCSLIFYDENIIKEIYQLEGEMDELEAQLIMHAALATRSPDDAEKIVSIYNLAISMDYISDAAGDIAKLAKRGARLRSSREFFASSSTNFVHVLPIYRSNPFIGKRIKDVYEELGGIFDVIAIRRNRTYIFEPNENEKILDGDVLYVKGSAETIENLIIKSGEKPEEEITIFEEGVLDSLLQLKNVSELMVDLAYSALLTRSKIIAEEVCEMEEYIDNLTEEFKDYIFKSKDLSLEEKICMMGLADAYEEIADAAVNMVYSLKMGLKPHPIIDIVIDEAQERFSVIEVNDEMSGSTISDLKLAKRGITVLAIRRGREWLFTPPYSKLKLRKGDILIVSYYSEAEEVISKLESIKAIKKLRESEYYEK